MRNMSFSMTTAAIRDHSKTVTRRLGWWTLQPGTILQAVEKARGLKRGEHVVPICLIRVVSVHAEQLATVYAPGETAREGFPELSAGEFCLMFREANGQQIRDDTLVNRIEFEYVP
jgi:hypothetical protein